MQHGTKERLKWRSKRSILELDLYFERFIQSGQFDQLNDFQLQQYHNILEIDDYQLLELMQRKINFVDQPDMQDVIDRISLIKFFKDEIMNNSEAKNVNVLKAQLDLGLGTKLDFPILNASIGQNVVDIRTLGKEGVWSYDPAFLATAACESKITYIDGEKGELLYRGYPIEQLAEQSTHLEVAFLLLNGELPSILQKENFEKVISKNAMLDDQMINIFKGFNRNAHPMAMLSSAVAALAAYYPEAMNYKNDGERKAAIVRLIAKMPTIVASCYRHLQGLPFMFPRNDMDYSSNFLYMMFATPCEPYMPNPIISKALDRILLLHADHEQNASTSTVRVAGSSGTHPFAAITAGIACLWGPAHGGANEAVLKMLVEIGDEANVESYIQGVKDKKYRLMGFGHRVYKNMDPRAAIMRKTCYEVLSLLDKHEDSLFKLAMKLEKIALSDQYFIDKKLYPNVDFYSGIILRAIGIPAEMFTTIFALSRIVGWLSQWQEMITEPELKISRPRQLYTGNKFRDYLALNQR